MKKWLLLIGITLLTLLAACGTDDNQEKTDNGSDDTSKEQTVSIEDATGNKKIKGLPKKIVVLEWYNAEQLLSLGIQPAGIPNIDGFNSWMGIEEDLDESVVDVGTRAEPNLEAISRLDPDLIIAAKFRHEQILDKLEDIAQVVMFSPYSKEGTANMYDELMGEFKTIAKVTGKENEAEQKLADLDDFYDEQKQRLADAGIEDAKYLLTMAFSSQNSPILRLYANNSYPVQALNNVGLTNAYETDEPQTYGFSEIGVEPLQRFQDEDLHFFSIVQEDDNIFKNQLKGNPAWENLNFVEGERAHYLPGDTPVIGGVSSAKALVKQMVDTMVNE
ncbi:iron-siderophore ABC transporter substrate-binding protein [Lentibacillus cibarius]|uniref:Iron-siderophore ABC transporter substrate-binding protein n=1 Tax=Lentibacillus cibarius TaxID=2583219 RepID=A0A549YI67_9BACI|nr:iron-siderophore ABC transporter substrate-binding protein [Lentibacillus cibarius]TRM11572.1 iron-siderophore ABC transporter substrate-binding protein [Lentibacillus cibarius]